MTDGAERADRRDGCFVTGGTGFVGRHLVSSLLRRPDGRVFVLVRRQSRERFETLRAQWAGAQDRVVPVIGDLDAPDLGLEPERVAELRACVGHFFHVAGLYDMAADAAALRRVNVGGTQRAIELAERLDVRCFHHVSSIAVAGHRPGVFGEDMFDEATGLDDPYFRTKHDAEGLVRTACRVPWRIYRPSLVVGHSETGETDKADGPYYLFPVLEQLGAALPATLPLPAIEGGFMNLVPVDFVAAAIDHIAHLEGQDRKTFHLVDPTTRTFGEVLDILAGAAGAPRFSLRVAGMEGILAPVAHALARRADGIAGRLVERVVGVPLRTLDYVVNPTTFDCRNTLAALAGSGIQVPPLESYADRLWRYWEQHLNADTSHGRSLERAVRGKVVLITGASSGIGRATALKVGAAGARVILVARDAERLHEVRALVEEAGGSAAVLPADLTNAESVEKLCRDIGEQFGGVDILVNNAGRSIRRSVRVSEDRFHDFSRTMDVNYFGALRLILALLPGMRERGGGHIINVSSIGVQVGPPRFSAYIASKAALDGFTRCAAPELMGYGIDVTTIYMPLVKTDMIAPTKLYDSFSAITPAQAADMICSAIVRRPRRVSTVFGLMGQLGASLAPSVSDVWLHLAYRLFPDSAAARGDVPYDEERPGSLGAVFAKLLPGVHW